jgi:hypothetical protein
MLEGSGAGPIHRTSGSGFGRPKNIRIRNTAVEARKILILSWYLWRVKNKEVINEVRESLRYKRWSSIRFLVLMSVQLTAAHTLRILINFASLPTRPKSIYNK